MGVTEPHFVSYIVNNSAQAARKHLFMSLQFKNIFTRVIYMYICIILTLAEMPTPEVQNVGDSFWARTFIVSNIKV